MFGYVGHGIIEGDWGWDAVKSGLITAGAAWLTYNTAGAAAGLFTDIGVNSTLSTVLGNGVGNATGSFAGDVANQLVFNEPGDKFNINQSLQSGLYGLGGGLAAGAVDVSPIAKWDFPMHHTAKHLIRSTAYEMGGNLLSGQRLMEDVTFGLNPGIILPITFDATSLTTSYLLKRRNIPITIDYGLGELDESTREYTATPIDGAANDWFLKTNKYSGIGVRDSYSFNNFSSNSLQPLLFIGTPNDFVFYNTIYQNFIRKWR